jgi:mono/diheme cytochrome c family protein
MQPAATEPRAGSNAIPIWLVILSFVLIFLMLNYFDYNGGWFKTEIYAPFHTPDELLAAQPKKKEFDIILAQKRFHDNCAICHQDDGMGRPGQFPPLAGSEWANGSPNRMIRIPLVGITGTIKVKGQTWNLAMPNAGAALSDEDLALALSYIRVSWGNKGSLITPAQVKAVRAEVGGRSQPLNGEAELLKVPEK